MPKHKTPPKPKRKPKQKPKNGNTIMGKGKRLTSIGGTAQRRKKT